MSLDYSLLVDPLILPEINSPLSSSNHSRSSSCNSIFSYDSSSESVDTQLTTPFQSPTRQNGPLLLPKIRLQDQEMPLSASNFSPNASIVDQYTLNHQPSRCHTFPETFSSDQHFPSHFYTMDAFYSHDSCDKLIDELPIYQSIYPSFPPMTEIPWDNPRSLNNEQTQNIASFVQIPTSFDSNNVMTPQNPLFDDTRISLIDYLSSPNPSPALVRQITINIRNITKKYFWWDIRQTRSWDSFNISTLYSIPDLNCYLNKEISCLTLPMPPYPSSRPENETELSNIYNSFYAAKLNAALSVTQGPRHLVMQQTAKNSSESSFISTYIDEIGHLASGSGIVRIVGLVKSYDIWNSSMRTEGNHRKVKYLRGLSNLHYHMREHGCRYGFIITEIEIVVVRNGTEKVPYFGYLEIQTIQLATNNSHTRFEGKSGSLNENENDISQNRPKMTALLALWYLHMLARDVTTPGQASWRTEIRPSAEGTRRKCLKKDDWIPEPQLAEKREARRIRGWVFAEDAVGRKELGRRVSR